MCVCGVTVGYAAAVEAAVKRGNGNSQRSTESPDRPVSSVTPTHASASGPRREQKEMQLGEAQVECYGGGAEIDSGVVEKLRVELREG